jgi:L-rhamnose mutarotase
MHRLSVKMKLFKGNETEYKRRHDEIWPELKLILKEHGIHDYSIFLDNETATLFAVMKVENAGLLDELRKHPVMRKWWTYMKDLMLTNNDDSPVAEPLVEVFYLE